MASQTPKQRKRDIHLHLRAPRRLFWQPRGRHFLLIARHLLLLLLLLVREYRKKKHLTQVQLAELLESSQSRVAKVEAADESVSLDLLIRSLLALGATHQDLAKVITGKIAQAS